MSAPKECMICYRDETEWNGTALTKCGHEMCMECFLRVAGKGGSCPMCRGGLPSIQHEAPASASAQIAAQTRYENGQRLKRESKMRRDGYLAAKKEMWASHCTSCTDPTCIATHERKTNWLNKGRLSAVPPPLSSVGKLMIGYLLGFRKMGKEKQQRFDWLITYEKERNRRSIGLLDAISMQQSAAYEKKELRTATAGNNTERLASGAGVKVFTGFTLPKRGARVGDSYEKDGRTAQCVGFHLWRWSDGTKSHLDGKRWITA